MSVATRAAKVLTCLVAGLALAACAGGDPTTSAAKEDDAKGGDGPQVESVLVIDGTPVDGERARAAAAREREQEKGAGARRRVRSEVDPIVRTWPAPELNADGTIDDGPDPFEGERVAVQPIPVEDDPSTTRDIDAAAADLRRIDRADWDRWLGANANRSPWQQGDDAFAAPIVDVTVERCGGARTVATGVVLANETVVTTVHAVESAAKRVRVSSTVREGQRIPAMVRYLDVDDDVAVLKVPGLRIRPMPFYTPADSEPRFGYAYGVANVGVSGALRRTPVMVSTREATVELEQPDGFAEQITDRSVFALVGGITTGFSGGVVAATNDTRMASGFGFHGLIRARVPYRADTGGIVVPSRLVREAITASQGLDTWFEHRAGGCPQWRR